MPWIVRGGAGDIPCLVTYYGDLRLATTELEQTGQPVLPATLIARAERDELIPNDHAAMYADRASARGAEVKVVSHPNGAHAFDLRNDDDTSRAIIKETIDFLQAQFS